MTTLRICFIGDSILQGTGDAECLGWPGRLGRREAAAGHDVTIYNLGVRAETTRDIAARWRAEATSRLPEPFPGALVFSFGVNDMAETPETGLRVPMAESLENARTILGAAAAWKPVLWVGPAPADMSRQPFSPGPGVSYSFQNDRTRELSGAYARMAEERAIPYFDSFGALADNPRWSGALAAGDGIHPVAAGYAQLAELIGAWPAWRAWFD
ncbi:MAG: GDSL-type esterase/lipase family protein [Alphaproteobacteria bacterium]|nr:GDSL-type esterase/lipase family protein [Alphaproteobacteria bacterium]